MRRETDFGQGGNGKIDGRGVLAGGEARRADGTSLTDDSLDRRSALA
jgi:hypothetical protein